MKKENKKKSTKTQKISYLLSGLTVFNVIIAAAFALTCITESGMNALSAAFLVSLLILLAIPLINKLLLKRLKNGKIDVKDQQQELLRRRGEAEKCLAEAARKTVRLRRIMNAYTAFLIVLTAFMLFSCIVVTVKGYFYIPVIVFALTSLIAPLYQASLRVNDFSDFSQYCNPEEYKKLHSLAHKAAKTLGIDGEIRIIFLLDCNLGIAQIGKVYSLQVGVVLLDVIHESELYQMLLHEFGHLTKDVNLSYKENRLFDKLSQSFTEKSFTERYFGYIAALYCREYSLYRMTASQTVERKADEAVLTHGDPQEAMNGLAKMQYYARFSDELHLFMDGHFYAPETMYENLADIYADKFRIAAAERGDFWKELSFREIQPRISSHPILRLRMEALGISDYTVTFPERSEKTELRDEAERARASVNRTIYEDGKERYPEERKTEYLEPKARLDEWFENGKPLDSENSRDILNLLRAFMLSDELKAACDRIIETAENESETAHALFCKGLMLLCEYDKSGIPLIYRAIEINSNYARDGMNAIGDFCCKNGYQAELDEYRERAAEEAQRYEDEYSRLDCLLPTDNLSKEEGFPEGMLEEILAYIRSIDENAISRIFLVRKTVTESFFGSVFVIDFKPNTENEVIGRVMGKIFNHLDVHPSQWQFSLFYYDEQTAKAVAKVRESCVYTAE